MSLAPLELIDAHPWQRVTFTTYALSLSFFEAVILDALVRGRSAQALILSDVEGVRASLGELGAQRVGKDYEVEPVAVRHGVFHPKISVLYSADECHVLIGSGNLTFNGWGGNCEVVEHLHPSFAADALLDLAGFFELIASTGRIKHHAESRCLAVASDLRRAIEGRARGGKIRLLHSLSGSISEQVAQLAADLGGARQVVVAAPFWDAGPGIDELCASLGLHQVLIHSHSSGCAGRAGAVANWPFSARSRVHAVELDVLSSERRRLHAKVFEIQCEHGRIVISGSANGSQAALGRNHNVEACVARIQSERVIGWSFRSALPPDPPPEAREDDEKEGSILGVLRATLEADRLAGTVLTPRMIGPVNVLYTAAMHSQKLGEAHVDAHGNFSISAPNLEELSWRGGRLVIRVRDEEGREATGFVSVASFGDITRRAGLAGRRLFALLAGIETPADVAAILAWIHEDPKRLAITRPNVFHGGIESNGIDRSDDLVAVATLVSVDSSAAAAHGSRGEGVERWSRFMEQVFAAFRESRGPLARVAAGRPRDDEDEDGDEASESGPRESEADRAIYRAFETFEKLFAMLVDDEAPERHVIAAFDLTHYLCDRMRPEAVRAKEWLHRLIRVLLKVGVPPERRSDIAASVLVLLGVSPDPHAYRWARECILQLGIDFGGGAPPEAGARGFLAVLPQQAPFSHLWTKLASMRTYSEQVRAYVQALNNGVPGAGYPDLPRAAPYEWPTLERAITSGHARSKLIFGKRSAECCPACDMRLPPAELQKLKHTGIATAKNCCAKVVILTEA